MMLVSSNPRGHEIVRNHTLWSSWRWGLAFCLLTVACAGSAEHDRLMREKYPTYPELVKRAIDRGYPMRDMDQDQIYLALGEPVCKRIIDFEGRKIEVWLFPPAGRDPCTTPEFRVYFEEGVVTGWVDFKQLPHGVVPPTVKRGDDPNQTTQY